tara:strand:- start:335 stop:547 length:213 start_codon:yes stop_codon:yes gene_type:complete
MKKTHIKMAKKIRLKESELISLIERVINTNNETEKKEEIVTEEKEDTVIKLTQNDLKNIIERINKKSQEK